MTTPFGATSVNEADTARRTIEFSLNPAQEKEWEAFDAWSVTYFAKHSLRLFKRIMTEEQVRENYRSPVTKRGDYRGHP